MAPLDLRQSCSALHRALSTSTLGTAPQKTAYLVVEHRKPWPAKPKKAELPGAVRAALKAGPEKLSLMLTPPQDERGLRGRIYIWRPRHGLYREFPLEQIEQVVAQFPRGFAPASPTLMVCTHGSRDACCGRLGFPLFRACRESLPEWKVLECSHLGGHRMAPTCFSIPEWRFYGRVDRPEELVQVLRTGKPHLAIYRGSGLLPEPAQVVEGRVWEHLGRPPLQVQLLDWDSRRGAHRIRLEADGVCYLARVRELRVEAPASCSDVPEGKVKTVEDYRLESFGQEGSVGQTA
ncbi:MAG: hypothetical protein HY319_08575 [Armatimonadetes bacterium]|nr:hypothetical protein [Armatimonadota bacterium]